MKPRTYHVTGKLYRDKKVLEMWNKGVGVKRIMNAFQLSNAGVYNILNRYEATDHKPGRKKLWHQLDLFEDK